jgi:hypothetical protein
LIYHYKKFKGILMLKKIIKSIGITSALMLAAVQAQAGIISYTSSGSFIVPDGVTSITAMVIGGGGAGTGTHGNGGGGGYLDVGFFSVTSGSVYDVIVGTGGASDGVIGNRAIGGTGGTSSITSLLSALGGFGGSHPTWPTNKPESGDGGSGGGGGGNSGFGGQGGSAGSNGFTGNTYLGGDGQGALAWSDLSLFTQVALTAGLGGDASPGSHQGGGGGGGVVIDGFGIFGDNSIVRNAIGGFGGHGYGAGGGSSGYNRVYGTGGAGAGGLVVIEFKTVSVPEPSTLAIFALGMIGLASRQFKKQS